jgi:transposase-like protein
MQPIENYCCQNKECPDAGQRGKGNLYFRGWSGLGQRIRMVYCRSCKKSFSQRRGTVFERSGLPEDKVLSILEHLREGCGTRGTSRLVHVTTNTVTRYAGLSGQHGKALHDEVVAFSPSDT